MGLDDITGDAEIEHDADKLEDYIEQMDEHVDEMERLQNMVVAFSSRLEQLEDRLTAMERMLTTGDSDALDGQTETNDEFLGDESDTEEADKDYSWE